jgi:probable HAF family extracellular repeat protein
MKNTVRVTTIGCALLAGATAWGQSVRYQLVEIDSPGNCANAINNRQQVVGTQGLLFDAGVLTTLPIGGNAVDINNRGQIIVGNSIFDRGTSQSIPPISPGLPPGQPLGMNDLGDVVGEARLGFGDAPNRAFLWSSGVMTALGTLGEDSFARAINNRRHIVGGSVTSNPDAHAFLWIDGVMSDLGTLGGGISDAFGINNGGIIVGGSLTTSGSLHAFMMAEGGPMIDLGTLGGPNSTARSINESGEIVGNADVAYGMPRAFLYRNGTMTDLNSALVSPSSLVLTQASDINDDGAIAGCGVRDGVPIPFLLTPSH